MCTVHCILVWQNGRTRKQQCVVYLLKSYSANSKVHFLSRESTKSVVRFIFTLTFHCFVFREHLKKNTKAIDSFYEYQIKANASKINIFMSTTVRCKRIHFFFNLYKYYYKFLGIVIV